MPFLEGKSCFRELQQTFPAMATRVVFVTGLAEEDETKRFLQQTGQPYLAKPVRPNDLVAAVAQMAKKPALIGSRRGCRWGPLWSSMTTPAFG